MQKNSKRPIETTSKFRLTATLNYLESLSDDAFIRFVREHIQPRISLIKSRKASE
jgi:hypothetical protein